MDTALNDSSISRIKPIEELTSLIHRPLLGKKIILGVTGSSSIYKSIDLARKLMRMGAIIRVVMTRFATKLVTPDLFHWATGSKPYIEMTGETEHIDLAKWGDAIVIAPATLNTMSKIAHGILDELLQLTAVTMMGEGKKVIIVPAMNIRLMNSPQYKRVTKILEEEGVVLIPPFIEEDKAKYPPLEDLAHCIDAIVNRGRDLVNTRIIVTAGPTREHIDPVRVITNPSSGLMGVIAAREAACRGASATLIHGPVSAALPYMVERIYTETTEDMARTISDLTSRIEYDAGIFSAAPADYRPKYSSREKIPSRAAPTLTIELESTPKIIKNIAKRPKIVVGFAAETCDRSKLLDKALEKLKDYGVDLIVANNVLSEQAGFAKDFLDAVITSGDKVIAEGLLTKYEVARLIVDYIVKNLGNTTSQQ